MKRFVHLILFSVLAIAVAHSQESPRIKFGNVTAADLQRTVYSVDSSADAVVIADIGHTNFVGNMKGTFSLEFKKFKRAHILNKNGYDIADVSISLYTNGQMEEDLENLKAVTYNLENGKLVETKLDVKNAVFKDKINKNWVVRKFTFPNIKAGSIIEYEYKVKSDFIFNLQPWEFQGAYPRLSPASRRAASRPASTAERKGCCGRDWRRRASGRDRPCEDRDRPDISCGASCPPRAPRRRRGRHSP